MTLFDLLKQQPKTHLSYLVDNDLSPGLAQALKDVGFNAIHAKYQFPQYVDASVPDDVQIEHCAKINIVWITADFKAERKARIGHCHGIWLGVGKTEDFATWDQLKIVSRVLDELEYLIGKSRGAMHFRAGKHGGSRPEILWAQHSFDRPKDGK